MNSYEVMCMYLGIEVITKKPTEKTPINSVGKIAAINSEGGVEVEFGILGPDWSDNYSCDDLTPLLFNLNDMTINEFKFIMGRLLEKEVKDNKLIFMEQKDEFGVTYCSSNNLIKTGHDIVDFVSNAWYHTDKTYIWDRQKHNLAHGSNYFDKYFTSISKQSGFFRLLCQSSFDCFDLIKSGEAINKTDYKNKLK